MSVFFNLNSNSVIQVSSTEIIGRKVEEKAERKGIVNDWTSVSESDSITDITGGPAAAAGGAAGKTAIEGTA